MASDLVACGARRQLDLDENRVVARAARLKWTAIDGLPECAAIHL
jgi:hypothetical protein